MTLQLPVEGGHEDGRVFVRHRSEENLLDVDKSAIGLELVENLLVVPPPN